MSVLCSKFDYKMYMHNNAGEFIKLNYFCSGDEYTVRNKICVDLQFKSMKIRYLDVCVYT